MPGETRNEEPAALSSWVFLKKEELSEFALTLHSYLFLLDFVGTPFTKKTCNTYHPRGLTRLADAGTTSNLASNPISETDSIQTCCIRKGIEVLVGKIRFSKYHIYSDCELS
jgi:hypothetical protein